MAKSQPKIDDIKDLKKVTVTSDGLMSKEDKEKIDTLINRTIKVEGYDKAGSSTTIPLNFKSGDGIINIEGQVNSGILDIIFSSVNTLAIYGALDPQDLRDTTTGIYELVEGNLYYFTPNPICGTDADNDSLFGKLIALGDIDGDSKSLYYHSYTTNKIHVCSGYNNGSEFVWSNWERLLTCKDETDVIIGEEGKYSYTIDRGGTEINVDLNFNPKSDIIEIDISSFKDTVPTYIGFNIIFSTPITGGVTVVINNGTSKTINYTQSYQDPSFYTGAMFVIEYRIWNRHSDWLYHNRII